MKLTHYQTMQNQNNITNKLNNKTKHDKQHTVTTDYKTQLIENRIKQLYQYTDTQDARYYHTHTKSNILYVS